MSSKLKNILNELSVGMTHAKMGGYDIQLGKVVTAKDFPAFKTPTQIKEEQDHEVSMAQSSLDAIINYATKLKENLGTEEKEVPAWIQDHISKAENFIQQAANHYHEYGGESGEVANGEMHEGYKKGDWVIVDNPHWGGGGKPQRRKVRLVVGDTLFFAGGDNSSDKYVTPVKGKVTEGKDDYVASNDGVMISLKKGYKHHSEDKLYSLYDKLSKLVKGKKVKKVELVFEDKR